MSHKGVRHDPLADIQLIRDNLNDRYQRGFPIIKELLQNAEDAHATRVEIGLCDGFANAEHPLLATPGIFVINDGPFSSEDAEAIGGFGLSYKGGEQQSIGKFGLGIKSLFHICEAFFYLSSPDIEEDRNAEEIGYPRNDILNPWSSEDNRRLIYPKWDQFSLLDQKLIQYRLDFLLEEPNWFCLWIPVRSRKHELKEKPIMSSFIEDYQPPESVLFEKNTGENVAAILPLLRSVKLCRGWIIGENLKKVFFCAEVSDQSSRCSYEGITARDKTFETRSLSGEVELTRNEHSDPVDRIEFWGKEKLIPDNIFKELQNSEHWPHTSTKNAKTRLSEQRPEKADPHCAVVLTRLKADGYVNELITNWSVFLPLGSQQQEHIPLSSEMQVHIFLHGYFFLDAGRDHIEDTDIKTDNVDKLNKRPRRGGREFTYALRYTGEDGKRRCESLGHADRRKAEKQRALKEKELRMGYVEPDSMKLRDFTKDSLARTGDQIRESTRCETESAMKDFIDTIGNIDFRNVSLAHGEQYLQKCLDRGNTQGTVAKKLRHIKRVFKLAVNRKQLDENPLQHIAMPKSPKKKINIYTDPQCRRIQKAAQEFTSEWNPERSVKWDLIISVALATAMRRAELLNCTWGDVDFEAQTIEVNPKQNTKETWQWLVKDTDHRTLPLTEEIIQMLVDHQAQQPEGYPYVFVPRARYDHIQNVLRPKGKWTLSDSRLKVVNNFKRSFDKILRKAGVKSGTFHDIRRTAITMWFVNGMSEYDVMVLAGHSSFATTHKFYLAVSGDLVRRARVATAQGLRQKLVRFGTRPLKEAT